jgi:hypothetical protein
MLAGGWLVDNLVLEDPGKVVGDEDGVKACREGGVDVGAGAVADHPGVAGFAAVVGGEGEVGFVVFFGQNLYGGEVWGQAGASEFAGLFFGITLGDHDEAMAGGEIGEGGGDVGEELDLLIGDGLGEAFDAAMLFFGEGDIGELLEAGDERSAKAVQAVAMGEDGCVLDAIEMAADLFGGMDAVIEVGDEAGDGSLEVDIVLPEGVVGVDQQGLIGVAAEGLGRRLAGSGLIWEGHRLIIRRFRMAFVTKVRLVCHAWGI